jgi:hypothetical protein
VSAYAVHVNSPVKIIPSRASLCPIHPRHHHHASLFCLHPRSPCPKSHCHASPYPLHPRHHHHAPSLHLVRLPRLPGACHPTLRPSCHPRHPLSCHPMHRSFCHPRLPLLCRPKHFLSCHLRSRPSCHPRLPLLHRPRCRPPCLVSPRARCLRQLIRLPRPFRLRFHLSSPRCPACSHRPGDYGLPVLSQLIGLCEAVSGFSRRPAPGCKRLASSSCPHADPIAPTRSHGWYEDSSMESSAKAGCSKMGISPIG